MKHIFISGAPRKSAMGNHYPTQLGLLLLTFLVGWLISPKAHAQVVLENQELKEVTSNNPQVRLFENPRMDTSYANPIFIKHTKVERLENFGLNPGESSRKDRDGRGQLPTANIIVNFGDGFDDFPGAKEAFQFAVDIWAAEIFSPVPIIVDAEFTTFDNPNVLGSAGPALLAQVLDPSIGRLNTFYPIALANSLIGSDASPTNPDINVNFNSSATFFYFGLDGNPAPNQFDFVSIVLHELGHGLGYIGSGSATGTATATGQDPWIYDIGMEDFFGNVLIDLNAADQRNIVTSEDSLFYNGDNARAALSGERLKMFAPTLFNNGSSYSHADETEYPQGTINSLMTPSINFGEVIHTPGPATRGLFKDMGWVLSEDATGSFITDDVGIVSIDSPSEEASTLGASEDIEITLANFGTNDLTNFTVSYTINGGNRVDDQFTNTLLARTDTSYTFTIPADLSDPSVVYELKVFTSLGSDSNRSNDTISVFLNKPKNVLYSQSGGSSFNGLISVEDIDSDDEFRGITDDIVIPEGVSWKIQRMKVDGFNNANSDIPTVRVFIYDNNNGVPGNEIYNSGAISPTNLGFNFDVILPNAPTLLPGTYWIGIAGILELNFGLGQFWAWEILDDDTPIGNEPHLIVFPRSNPNAITLTPASQILNDTRFNPIFDLFGDVLLLAPTALPAQPVTDTSFVANWQAINGVDEYRIDISTDNFSTFIVEDSVVANDVSSFLFSDLSPGTTYAYRVRFIDDGGSTISDNSNVISVTTCSAPTSPSTIDVIDNTPPNGMAITLTSGDGLSTLVLVKEGSDFNPATDFPVDGVNYLGSTFFGNGDQIGDAFVVLNSNTNNLTVSNLQADLTYFVATFERSCPDFPIYLRDGVSTVSNVVTSVEDVLLQESLDIYPNPAQSALQIDLNSSRFRNAEVTLFNSLGLPVMTNTLKENERGSSQSLNTENLIPGLYILKVKTERAVTEIKVVIE